MTDEGQSFSWIGTVESSELFASGKKRKLQTIGAGPCEGRKRVIRLWETDKEGNLQAWTELLKESAWQNTALRFAGYREFFTIEQGEQAGKTIPMWQATKVERFDPSQHQAHDPSDEAPSTDNGNGGGTPAQGPPASGGIGNGAQTPMERGFSKAETEAWWALEILFPIAPAGPDISQEQKEAWLQGAAGRLIWLAHQIAASQESRPQ